MALFDSAIFWFCFALAGEEEVALHSTIPFYLAFVFFLKGVGVAKRRCDMCKALFYGFSIFFCCSTSEFQRQALLYQIRYWHRFS